MAAGRKVKPSVVGVWAAVAAGAGLCACGRASPPAGGDRPSEPAPSQPAPAPSQPAPSQPAPGSGSGGEAKPAPRAAPLVTPQPTLKTTEATIAGKTFRLEVADTDATRFRGLSGRTSIEPRGGMLFVFPQAMRLSFVMRDCVIPIDIAYLDGAGRVLSVHEMKVEAPRTENEDLLAYDSRLTKYDSRFPAQFAVEVAGGTFRELGVKPGDLIRLDAAALKRAAR